jgi:alpha-ketoglutarate-dependent 2,4-dichlorophenoxyacetate dioxygenase
LIGSYFIPHRLASKFTEVKFSEDNEPKEGESMKIKTLRKGFVAEISDIDLSHPLDDTSFAALQETIDAHGVAALRGQFLDDENLVALAERFGTLEIPLKRDQYGGVHKKVTLLSNVGEDGHVIASDGKHAAYLKGNTLWHSDSSFKPVPCTYSLLAAHAVPSEGGNTEFADARACYDDWPDPFGDIAKDTLEDLICEHSIIYSRSIIVGDIFSAAEKDEFTPPHQPLVRTHPRTGRKIYYVGSHCSHVVGWPIDKGRALTQALTAFCVRPEAVYSHTWQSGDLVIWDNRSVLHRGMAYNPAQPRVMHRATVAGDGPLI